MLYFPEKQKSEECPECGLAVIKPRGSFLSCDQSCLHRLRHEVPKGSILGIGGISVIGTSSLDGGPAWAAHFRPVVHFEALDVGSPCHRAVVVQQRDFPCLDGLLHYRCKDAS